MRTSGSWIEGLPESALILLDLYEKDHSMGCSRSTAFRGYRCSSCFLEFFSMRDIADIFSLIQDSLVFSEHVPFAI